MLANIIPFGISHLPIVKRLRSLGRNSGTNYPYYIGDAI